MVCKRIGRIRDLLSICQSDCLSTYLPTCLIHSPLSFCLLDFFSRPVEIKGEFRSSSTQDINSKLRKCFEHFPVRKSVSEQCIYEMFFLIRTDFNGTRLKTAQNRIVSGINLRKTSCFSNKPCTVSIMTCDINILSLNRSEKREKEICIIIRDMILYVWKWSSN